MEIKRITTTIQFDLWREAQFNNVCWSTALEEGVKLLIGNNVEKEKLEKRIQFYENKLEFYRKRLKQANELEKTANEKQAIITKHSEYLTDLTKRYFDQKFTGTLDALCRLWNKETGMFMRPGAFEHMLKEHKKKKEAKT